MKQLLMSTHDRNSGTMTSVERDFYLNTLLKPHKYGKRKKSQTNTPVPVLNLNYNVLGTRESDDRKVYEVVKPPQM